MKISTEKLFNNKYIVLALLVVVIGFLLIRFVHIDADFPSHITTSGELYTDEGWYAGSAIRHYLTGQWYLEGDINFAILEPGSQILYRLSFAIFGLNLAAARITVAVAFLLLTIIMALWIRRHFGNSAALLAAILLSTNYFAFAYSRLAIRFLIATLFIVAAFFVADRVNTRLRSFTVVIAALLLAYGVLTYTPVVFAIPVLLFLLWKEGDNRKGKFQAIITASLVLLVVLGSYYSVMFKVYPAYLAGETHTITNTFFTNFPEWLVNLFKKVAACFKNLGVDFTVLTALLTLAALIVSKRFRTSPIVLVLLAYSVTYTAVLSVSAYGPPRYYLLMLVPFSGLCAVASKTLYDWFGERQLTKVAYIPVILVFIVSIHGGWNILSYLSKPQYSFYEMATSVKNIIQEREGTTRGVTLFGDIADSVSLEAGTNAMNSGNWISSTAPARMEKYHPNYLIVHTSNIDQVAASEGAKVTELGRWDVFNNYYANGEQVRLYYAAWP